MEPRPHVTVYHAVDCGLCARALEDVVALHAEIGFELAVVDIGGNEDLERRYRVRIPVVAVDGDEAFEYFVDPDALRARLVRLEAVPPAGSGGA